MIKSKDTKKESKSLILNTPLTLEKITPLKAGDMVFLSGTVFGARDMAHKRIIESIKNKINLPISLKDETIFYLGPSPTPPGKISGSIGPTTSTRMDELTEPLLKEGLRAMIGKGRRSENFKNLLVKYKAVYFIAPGGVAAYLSTKVKKIEQITYKDLGPEAIYRLEIVDFPLVVAGDTYGDDIFSLNR
jgi:fumarate hydratase subunit beta